MAIFTLNTGTDRTEIAIIDGKKILFQKEWASAHNEAERLFPALDAAQKKLGAKKIDKIFIVEGPGAFTSLRIGVTIANTLAFHHKASIIGTTTFEYLKMKLPTVRKNDTAIILKAGGEHCAVALPKSKKIHRLAASKLPEFFRKQKSIKYALGEKSLFPKNLKPIPAKQLKSLATIAAETAAKKPRAKKLIKPYYLNPPHITKSKKEIFA